MKPKNKFQKEVCETSKLLPKITKKQLEYACKKMPKYVAWSRNRLFCTECNHKWMPEQRKTYKMGVSILICPGCNEKVRLIDVNSNPTSRPYRSGIGIMTINQYMAVIQTYKDFQVVRMIHTTKYSFRKHLPEYFHSEVIQHFIHVPTKRMESMYQQCNWGTLYYDSWQAHSNLEIRSKSVNLQYRFRIKPCIIHPSITIHPILQRNGIKKSFFNNAPQRLMLLVLIDSKMETLLKAKQFSLLNNLLDVSPDVSPVLWDSIKICIRNNYIVKDAQIWYDHIKLLMSLNKDLRNRHYVCPKNIEKEHARYIAISARKRAGVERKERMKEVKKYEKKYNNMMKRFFGLSFTTGNFVIKPFKSVLQFVEEGDMLHHCIYSAGYYENPDKLLLSVRENNIPIETVEVDLRNMKVVQCRGRGNKSTKNSKRITKFINRNINKIKEANE